METMFPLLKEKDTLVERMGLIDRDLIEEGPLAGRVCLVVVGLREELGGLLRSSTDCAFRETKEHIRH